MDTIINQELQELKSQFENLKNEFEAIKGKDVISMKDAMMWLQVSRQCLHRWKDVGLIKGYFLGKKIYFKRSEILATIEAGEIEVS